MRTEYEKNGEAYRAHGRAVQRAKQRLTKLYPNVYARLLEEEKAREGIRTLRSRAGT